MKNLGIQTEITEASFTNRTQEMEGRILGTVDTIEDIDNSVKENVNSKNPLEQNIQEIVGHYRTMKRPN